MTNARGSIASRGLRDTRYNATVVLDREIVVRGMVMRILRALESCATVLILILISTAVLPLFLHGGPKYPDLTPATSLERASYWLAYAFTMLQLLLHPRAILRAIARNPFVIGLAFLAALSVIWSDDPITSLRLAFALVMWTLFGCYLAARYDTTGLLLRFCFALGIIALLSLAVGALAPDFGRESGYNGGAWRGVFTTKNVLGEMMLLAAVVFGSLVRRGGRNRVLAVLGFVAAIALIVLAKATAALLIVGALVITIPVVLLFRRSNAAAGLVLCVLLSVSAAASVAVTEEDTVLSVLGKDATLTGRTDLWRQAINYIEERPVLGYGYGAFWEPSARASEKVRAAVGWDAPHSHNGVLDVWLDVGLIGVLSLFAGYLLALRRAWAGLRAHLTMDGVWAMSFLLMLFLGNTTESSVWQSPLIWTIFVAVACMRWPVETIGRGSSRHDERPARTRAGR